MHHLKARPTQSTNLLQFWNHASGLSATQVDMIINMGGAYLNGKRCKDPSHKVFPRDALELYYRLPIEFQSLQWDPAWIIAQTPDYIIVNKPAGIPTQGRRDADSISLYDALCRWQKGYVGLHHRLDQDTSGLMLFTLNPKVNRFFAQLFQEQRIEKKYLALCQGPWPFSHGEFTVDAPIGADYGAKTQKQKVGPQGKPAITHLRLIHAEQDQLLIEASPKTGRTHQIRVHCAHVGIPLIGDQFYGHNGAPPFHLHCYSLAWPQMGPLKAGRFKSLPRWNAFDTFLQKKEDGL
ncbi:MAG: hypothetical protein H6510_09985 [Acidobacteria bacterium]|nr:hypothetical protein [Acidobacteriota bacterium]MCB9398137.1 hypothetical protein [Acidobacteriota bacterium]